MPNDNDYMRRYVLARYHRRRSAAIEFLGNRCGMCGSTETLEIDHRDAATKSFDLGKAFAGYSDARIAAELKKCWLLCAECHGNKTAVENAVHFRRRIKWAHGTLGGYRHCRCELCSAAKREHTRAYRARRKAQA